MPPPLPELVDGTVEFEVAQILASRPSGNNRQYLVVWKGYGPEHNTWEPEANLANCAEMLRDFKALEVQQAATATKPARKRKAGKRD